MVVRRKNGLEVHSSQVRIISEELPEWVQNCVPLVSLVFHLNYHCPTSTYAPINVMPHYPPYGHRWGKVGICHCHGYQPPTPGDDILRQTPTSPHLAPPYEVGFIGDLTIKITCNIHHFPPHQCRCPPSPQYHDLSQIRCS